MPLGLLVALALGTFAAYGEDATSTQSTERGSLHKAARTLQLAAVLDYDELAATGSTLDDVAVKADIVGIGRIVDIRLGYREQIGVGGPESQLEELQQMLVVIDPEKLAKGSELLGSSGQVFLDRAAPPFDLQTGDTGIEELRDAAVNSQERVAFMLAVKPPPSEGTARLDEFEGRAPDDPLLWPAHPSAVLGLDEGSASAYPVLTTEDIADTSQNLAPLNALGAEVDGFSTLNRGELATSSP